PIHCRGPGMDAEHGPGSPCQAIWRGMKTTVSEQLLSAREEKNPMFITFEGPEGGGKSTQARLLAERLQTTGYPVALTREPGGTPAGKAIRAIWDDPERNDLLPITDLLLLCADRAQHVGSLIRPALERGEIVISDRYADSTRAYQGYGSGLDVDTMETLLQIATGGLTPDLTLLLDIPAAEGL